MLKSKYALVTGGSGGIGFSIVKRFLEEGAFVGVHYCHDKEGAEKLVAMAQPGQCRAFQADFSESQQVLSLWDRFFDWSGTIDVLVNSAGAASQPALLNDLTEETWDQTFQVNTKAPFLLSRAAMTIMKQSLTGRIINISSIGVKFGGGPTTLAYSASKAALEAVTRSLAKEGAPYNVLVNAIQAGVTDTPFHQRLGRTTLSDRAKLVPLKRAARPEEIANAVLFLASDASSYTTGTILPVAGGE